MKKNRTEMKDLFNGESNAVFSEDRKYRYALWRVWDINKPKIMFIGLNPSTASENMDDPTIRRVKGFAKSWGYGAVYMMNLFAIVSSDPKILRTNGMDLLGDNNDWLTTIGGTCKDILFAWGNFKEAEERAKEVCKMFPNAICLGFNKNGTPKHPLYVSAKTLQVNYQHK